MEPCPICKVEMYYNNLGNRSDVQCPRCGCYSVTSSAIAIMKRQTFTPRQLANISGWLRENPDFFIGSEKLEFLKTIPTPSFHVRADKLLLNLEKLTSYAGEPLELKDPWLSMSWALNIDELREILEYLTSTHYLLDAGSTIDNTRLKIGAQGWAYLDSLQKMNQQSQQGFVAMWFSEGMQQVYDEAISAGIVKAGYLPHRVDLREHNEKIDDEIIAQIRRSRFVLADFTGHRGGVYYEAGFAKGLGLEVIWSCREDDLEKLHFDIRQYNCITWQQDKLGEFATRIKNRVEAVLGQGPTARGT